MQENREVKGSERHKTRALSFRGHYSGANIVNGLALILYISALVSAATLQNGRK